MKIVQAKYHYLGQYTKNLKGGCLGVNNRQTSALRWTIEMQGDFWHPVEGVDNGLVVFVRATGFLLDWVEWNEGC